MSSVFDGEPADTREAIMRATYEALREYGYAGLSISRIADRADLSKSSLYNHYDGKDDLLLDFVDFTIGQFVDAMGETGTDDPLLELEAFLSFGFSGSDHEKAVRPLPPAEPHGSFVELRAQAVHDDTFRERFTGVDSLMKDRIRDIIERGQDSGVFRDVDPESVAETLLTLTMGMLTRRATNDDPQLDRVRAEVDRWIETRLLAPDVEWR